MFVALTHRVLNELKGRGYQVLTSVANWDDDKSPVFWPEKVEGPIGSGCLYIKLVTDCSPIFATGKRNSLLLALLILDSASRSISIVP